MTPFDQIRSLVPKLSASDRKKVALLVNQFKGGKEVTSDYKVNKDWLLQGILQELKRRGHPSFGSVENVRKVAPNYELVSQEVRLYFEEKLRHGRRPATPTELAAFGAIVG
ncbi:MAG: hypothetical protein ACREMY_34030, partial [bacterium]